MTAAKGKFVTTIDIGDEDGVEVEVTWEGYHERAKVSGPPEDCYPEEGEMNIISVELYTDYWPEGLSNEEFKQVCDAQEERLIELAWEEFHDL